MACVLGLLQHNADEELWSACRDEHDEYEPAQQGGSLMWMMALHRIQDRSEQALDHLKGEVGCIDLSAHQGKDVEHAIRLIKSTYRVLKCSSTQTRSHVPLDFTKTVLKMFQTSSVPDFNDVFHRLEQMSLSQQT